LPAVFKEWSRQRGTAYAGLGEEYKQLAEKRMKEINAAYESLRRDNVQT